MCINVIPSNLLFAMMWMIDLKLNFIFTGELIFHDEVEYARIAVEKLQEAGVNKIIAMGRSAFNIHMRIAQEVSGVDIVIGGDTDVFLYTGLFKLTFAM